MHTVVQTCTRSGSAVPAAFPAPPTPCSTFAWCASQVPRHTVHESVPVPLPDGTDRVLFAETCPETGHLLYGPVLGGGDADESTGHARVLAAQLRVAAARLEQLATVGECAHTAYRDDDEAEGEDGEGCGLMWCESAYGVCTGACKGRGRGVTPAG